MRGGVSDSVAPVVTWCKVEKNWCRFFFLSPTGLVRWRHIFVQLRPPGPHQRGFPENLAQKYPGAEKDFESQAAAGPSDGDFQESVWPRPRHNPGPRQRGHAEADSDLASHGAFRFRWTPKQNELASHFRCGPIMCATKNCKNLTNLRQFEKKIPDSFYEYKIVKFPLVATLVGSSFPVQP